MKLRKNRTLIICILVPLAVGFLSALLTRSSGATYSQLIRPAFSPPGWLFPVVWTILYVLMGIASYFVLIAEAPYKAKENALIVYALQLLVNFFWTFFFFNLNWYFFSFLWLLLLLFFVILTASTFYQISKTAGYLMIPYILWLVFAGYLNLSIVFLN